MMSTNYAPSNPSEEVNLGQLLETISLLIIISGAIDFGAEKVMSLKYNLIFPLLIFLLFMGYYFSKRVIHFVINFEG